MSTAVKMWLLFQQLSDNSLLAGRDDIFYRIELLRNKYKDSGQLWDNPLSDLPRYRTFLTDATKLLTYVSVEANKTPALASGVDFWSVNSCYARLIGRGLKGEVMAGALRDHLIEDGELGYKMFSHLLDEMEGNGLGTGDLRYIGNSASLGSDNMLVRQLAEKKKPKAA